MIHAVVMGQLEEVLDLRNELVFAVARVGNLRGALVVEASMDQFRHGHSPGSCLPILEPQAWDASEFLRVVCDEDQVPRHSLPGDQHVIRTDWRSLRG